MHVEPVGSQDVAGQRQELAQRRCYLAFAALHRLVTGTALQKGRGSLLLLASPDSLSVGTAAAARIAGGATLLILKDAVEAKQSVRGGACDFLVSSLDESLRILKNEVRRAKPVGICLLGSPSEVVAECVVRGVQPDLLDFEEPTLERRGARLVVWSTSLEAPMEWITFCTRASGESQLARATVLAARAMTDATGLQARLHWLRTAPAVLGRPMQRMRCVPMSRMETMQFLEQLAAEGLTQVEVTTGS